MVNKHQEQIKYTSKANFCRYSEPHTSRVFLLALLSPSSVHLLISAQRRHASSHIIHAACSHQIESHWSLNARSNLRSNVTPYHITFAFVVAFCLRLQQREESMNAQRGTFLHLDHKTTVSLACSSWSVFCSSVWYVRSSASSC